MQRNFLTKCGKIFEKDSDIDKDATRLKKFSDKDTTRFSDKDATRFPTKMLRDFLTKVQRVSTANSQLKITSAWSSDQLNINHPSSLLQSVSQICASKKLDGDTTFRDQAVDVFMINADNIECIGVTVKECLHVGCYYHRAGSRIHAVTYLEHQDKQRLHFFCSWDLATQVIFCCEQKPFGSVLFNWDQFTVVNIKHRLTCSPSAISAKPILVEC